MHDARGAQQLAGSHEAHNIGWQTCTKQCRDIVCRPIAVIREDEDSWLFRH